MRSGRERARRIVQDALREDQGPAGSGRRDLARLWRDYLSGFRLPLGIAGILTLLAAAQPFAFMITNRYLVDDVLKVEEGIERGLVGLHLSRIWVFAAAVGGIWVLFIACNWTRTYISLKVGNRLIYALRKQLHEKLLSLHVGYFERTATGRIMSRVIDDVTVIQQAVATQFINALTHSLRLVIGMVVLTSVSWELALPVLLSLPLYALAFARVKPEVKRYHRAVRRLHANQYALAAERVMGIRVVQAFGRELAELRKFVGIAADRVRVQVQAMLKAQGLGLTTVTLSSVTQGIVIFLAFQAVRQDRLSLGTAMAFIFALPALFGPVNQLTTLVIQIQNVMVALRRVFTLLDEPVDVEAGPTALAEEVGRIRFRDVTFKYPGQTRPALKNIDFMVRPGEAVALMGPSGAGKSTVFKLLLRFYDPLTGEIRIGGVNLVDAAPESVRAQVRLVQQEPTVFSGTVGENIRYGRPDASPRDVRRAAKQADLHEFIMTLPDRYQTVVGEQGMTLSGGQKQRMSLATALLAEPNILLLDDTTSAVDAHTEARIRATLNDTLRGRTSLVITQRIATARAADRVFVIEHGRITQAGTHDELCGEPGFYREVCLQQEAAV